MNLWVEVDLDRIKENTRRMKETLKGSMLLAVVKSEGYGHGLVQTASAALEGGAQMLGVAQLDEAIRLRDAGIGAPILCLAPTPIKYTRELLHHRITPTVCDIMRAEALMQEGLLFARRPKVHVKVDTGMGRLGVPYYEAKEFVQKLMQMGIYIEGIYTHLSCADTDEEFSFEQYQRFCHLLKMLEEEGIHIPVKHVANSAAALMWECMHMDMARCGITIYGLYPSSQLKQKVNLSPAMQFKCRIVFLKMLKEPFPISYGRTYTAPAGTLIATVPVGYANGLPRSLSNKAYMLVNGVRCPLVGNVCMDFSMLDVTAAKDVKVGDEVVIFGQQQTGFIGVEEVATWAGTISYEIVCRVGRNSSRLYTREKEDRVPQQFRRRSMT